MDLTTIYTITASTATILTTLAWITYWLGGKFREIDMRFAMIDEKFKQIDERFSKLMRDLSKLMRDSLDSPTP